MINKARLVFLIFILFVISGDLFAAADWRAGGGDPNWFNGANWVGGTGAGGIPSASDWADVRSATWVPYQPVIAGGAAVALNVRINAYVVLPNATLTVNSGSLTVGEAIYIGHYNLGKNGEFIINGGTVTVGTYTAVGQANGNGSIYMNGGTLNAGILGLPQWWGTTGVGTGHVYIDGGVINSIGLIMGGTGNVIEFTKNFADGGGMFNNVQDMNNVEFDNWQAAIQNWVTANQIITSAGNKVQVDYSSVGDIRTTSIYSVVPEPMTMALLGAGGLFIRRRRK